MKLLSLLAEHGASRAAAIIRGIDHATETQTALSVHCRWHWRTDLLGEQITILKAKREGPGLCYARQGLQGTGAAITRSRKSQSVLAAGDESAGKRRNAGPEGLLPCNSGKDCRQEQDDLGLSTAKTSSPGQKPEQDLLINEGNQGCRSIMIFGCSLR